MKNLFFAENRFVMDVGGRQFEVKAAPAVAKPEVDRIAREAAGMTADEGAKMGDKLIAPPEGQKAYLESLRVKVDFTADVADGKFANKANFENILKQISAQVETSLKGLSAPDLEKAVGEAGMTFADAVKMTTVAYAYYLLQMAQADYDKLKDEDKKNVKTFAVKVDPANGNVSNEFKTADSKAVVAAPEVVATAVVGAPAEAGEVKVGGLKLKEGKTLDDVQGYVEALSLSTKTAVTGDILQGFTSESVLKPLGGKLSSAINKDIALKKIDALRGIVQEDVTDDNLVDFSARLAADFYARKIEAKLRAEYPTIAEVDWKDPKCKLTYSFEVKDGGDPTIGFTATTEFTTAYNVKKAAAEEKANPDAATKKAEMKKNPVINLLMGFSPEGEAILDKVANGQAAGFIGFLIGLVAAACSTTGGGGKWDTLVALLPESIRPAFSGYQKKIKELADQAVAKVEDVTSRTNDEVLKYLAGAGNNVYLVAQGGLRLKEPFTPATSTIDYLQIVIAEGSNQDVTFGEPLPKVADKNGKDIGLTVKELKDPGTYRISSAIPPKTFFSEGVTLKLIKKVPEAGKPAA
jgi:hypothetical protein